MFLRLTMLSLFLVVLSATTRAQEGKTSRLGEPVFPKLEYVNLNEEFGFRTDVMRGFGARVDDARRDADAAAVAGLAVQLQFAEKFAGRTARTVTAMQVLREAARIAEEQQSAEAVDAISLAAEQIPSSAAIVQHLRDAAQLFAQRGEGDFLGFVRIVNACDRVLDIYVDGKYMGFLYDGEENVFSTGNGTTHTRVTDAFGNTVSEVLYVKPDETVSWTIEP
ncbi:MAG: hypothetical protein JXA28_03590 [Bacteroidetes bacterium]|nr:hypothetical protein [Bacteroidota bacterium]